MHPQSRRNPLKSATTSATKFDILTLFVFPSRQTEKKRQVLTASASIFASSCSNTYPLVRGISITPSIIACATCTPLGPNSFARLCVSALNAVLPVAKEEVKAAPRTEAVAPVKTRVGGCLGAGEAATVERSSGSVAREKR